MTLPNVGAYALSKSRKLETDPLGGIVVAVDEERAVVAVRWCWGGPFHLRRYEIPADDLDESAGLGDAPGVTVRRLILAMFREVVKTGSGRFTEEHRQLVDDAHALVARAG